MRTSLRTRTCRCGLNYPAQVLSPCSSMPNVSFRADIGDWTRERLGSILGKDPGGSVGGFPTAGSGGRFLCTDLRGTGGTTFPCGFLKGGVSWVIGQPWWGRSGGWMKRTSGAARRMDNGLQRRNGVAGWKGRWIDFPRWRRGRRAMNAGGD